MASEVDTIVIGARSAGLVIVILVAGCTAAAPAVTMTPPASSAISPVATLPAGSIVPWLDATPTPIPSPTSMPIPAGTATCTPVDLRATAWWTGATGSMAGGVTVTNAGLRPCVVSGPPYRVALRSGGAILGTVVYRSEPTPGPGSTPAAAGPVLLEPGSGAGAFLLWSNWCSTSASTVTAVLVTLAAGEPWVVAQPPAGAISGSLGTPRCDDPAAPSSLSGWAFVATPPPSPAYSPQPASVSLTVPPTARPGADLSFLVSIANTGQAAASLEPCPTYTENLIVDGRALKPPAPEQLLLNCSAIGSQLAPGAELILAMHYAIPTDIAPGQVDLVWGLDPGGPLDASTAISRASLTIAGP